ncbi:MAG TPA: glutaredoxin family protein, partial [Candidatus Ozemobacteraceae bacterium]|nr:glutaredoxin family protein [Candidatus Ozemobacteraceae bacterium]
TWCPHCIRLLEFLRRERIPFQNFDVDEDDERWQEAMKLTGGIDIVPVVEKRGEVVFGAFNSSFEKRLRDLLQLTAR